VVKVIRQQAASPPHMDGSKPFARWCQCAPHLIHASLSPLKSKSQTASWSVQPFLHSSPQNVFILYNGPPFPLKIGCHHPHPIAICYYYSAGAACTKGLQPVPKAVYRSGCRMVNTTAGDESRTMGRLTLQSCILPLGLYTLLWPYERINVGCCLCRFPRPSPADV